MDRLVEESIKVGEWWRRWRRRGQGCASATDHSTTLFKTAPVYGVRQNRLRQRIKSSRWIAALLVSQQLSWASSRAARTKGAHLRVSKCAGRWPTCSHRNLRSNRQSRDKEEVLTSYGCWNVHKNGMLVTKWPTVTITKLCSITNSYIIQVFGRVLENLYMYIPCIWNGLGYQFLTSTKSILILW